MKYIIRALKELVYLTVMASIIIILLWLFQKAKQPQLALTDLLAPKAMFKCIIFFAAIAAIYPKIGYVKRRLYLKKEFSNYESLIIGAMEILGFEVEEKGDSKITFRQKSTASKVTRVWEDRVSFDISDNPVTVEGMRRDVDRLLSNISFRIKKAEENEEENL